jgi:hypothetical protein
MKEYSLQFIQNMSKDAVEDVSDVFLKTIGDVENNA